MTRSLARSLPLALAVAVFAPALAAAQDPGSSSAPAGSTASPSSGLVRHKIRLTFTGLAGMHSLPDGTCPGVAGTNPSNDVFEGIVKGDPANDLRHGRYRYVGDLVRRSDIYSCDLKPHPVDEWTYCHTHLTGHGVMRAVIEVQTDRPEGYVNLEWKAGTTPMVDSVGGSCEAQLTDEIGQMYLEDTEGLDFELKRTGPLVDGETYIQPSRGDGDPDGAWKLEILGPKKLKAVPGTYQVVRGQELTLDGSRSEGNITDYKWVIKMKECKDAYDRTVDGSVEKHGVTVKIRPLCAIDAELTVFEGSDKDGPEAASIAFSPRSAQTAFTSTPGDYHRAGLIAPCGCQLGKNICKVEYGPRNGVYGNDSEGHYFHEEAGRGTFDHSQYELSRVSDPSGLFDEWWWVSEPKLHIDRKELVNVILRMPSVETKNKDEGRQAELARLIGSVELHEKIHSDLIKQGVTSPDPAKKIETMLQLPAGDPAELRKCADAIIRQSDGRIRYYDTDSAVIEQLKQTNFHKDTEVYLPIAAGSSVYAPHTFRTPATESDTPEGEDEQPAPEPDWAPCSALDASSIGSHGTSDPP